MKEKFITSMLSEGGKISHKRVIAVGISVVLAWVIVYATLRAVIAVERKAIIDATMVFVLVMTGVATLPQLIALVRGTPAPKEDKTEQP